MLSSAHYEKATFPFHVECQKAWNQICPRAASTQVDAVRGGRPQLRHDHLEACVSNAGARGHGSRPKNLHFKQILKYPGQCMLNLETTGRI